MRKLIPVLAVVMLLAASCGGDEESVDSTTTSSSPATTAARPTTTSPPSPTTTGPVAPTVADTQPEPQETVEPTTTQPAQVQQIDAVVTLRAVGPIRIGMTVDEASAEAGVTLRRDFGRQASGGCYYVTPGAAMHGVSIMVIDDLIARVEIDSPSDIATRSGVRIGTAASNLREVYPNNIQNANDAVLDGEAMAFVPNDDFDADFRIYFEIENGQIARYRVGVKPAIDYLRGCPEE